MYTTNLSALLGAEFFLEMLKNEEISYDRIISDQTFSENSPKILQFNKPFSELAQEKKIQKADHILLILTQLNILPVLNQIIDYPNITILNANAGLASFGKKIEAEIQYLPHIFQSGFEIFFPFDQNQFFKILQKTEGKKLINLTNQEIPENIYQIPEEEEITFIDKALAEQPENIALINNPEAETHIIALGSYFEQLVQLSQLLLQREERYHLNVIAKLSLLQNASFQAQIKKAKKLIIIADHINDKAFLTFRTNLLNITTEKLKILTPNYKNLTTTLPDYQLEQTDFDALALADQI